MATLQGEQWVVFDDMTGGVNTSVPPHQLNKNECPDIVNVEWDQTRFGKKRNGVSQIADAHSFAADVVSLYRHQSIPGDTNSEMWAVDATTPPVVKRLQAASSSWTSVTVPDDISGPTRMEFATYNKKLFVAADSAVNRLHVWDGTQWRRVGLPTPSAPTAADTGTPGSAYAATLRYYKVSHTILVGSDVITRSELSAALTFTPDGGHTHARVTMPAVASGEVPTHWELWGSADGANYYRLASTVIGTTTFDDNVAPSAYPTTGVLAPMVGLNVPPISWRYITTDGSRLIGAGHHMQAGANPNIYANRVWFTPVFGTTDGVSDQSDERVPETTTFKYRIDLDPNDGDGITGLAPFDGVVWVFKKRRLYKLIPTGNVDSPFQVVNVTGRGYGVGCVESRTIRTGEDESGRPALYFCGERGPYRITQDAGIQFIGHNITGYWANLLLVAGGTQPLFAEWYPKRMQYIVFAAYRGETTGARTALIFNAKWGRVGPDGIVGGWARYLYKNQDNSGSAVIRAVTLGLPNVSGAASTTLQPWLAETGATKLLLMDAAAATDDVTVDFAAYVRLPEWCYAGPGKTFSVSKVLVTGRTQATTTLQCRLTQDFGDQVLNAAFTLTALTTGTATQERRVIKVEEAVTGPITACEVRVGEGSAQDVTAWQIESVAVLVKPAADV